MARGLNGRVAVEAGAATGIGRAVSLRLAQDGAAVIVNYAGTTQQPRRRSASSSRTGNVACYMP
jgi:3-oxoacyl-[acyl-carrier protein] reductase